MILRWGTTNPSYPFAFSLGMRCSEVKKWLLDVRHRLHLWRFVMSACRMKHWSSQNATQARPHRNIGALYFIVRGLCSKGHRATRSLSDITLGWALTSPPCRRHRDAQRF